MINEDDVKAINRIEREYLAYKINKYDDPDEGIVYSCLLCNGVAWSEEEHGLGSDIFSAIKRAMHFFPPITDNDISSDIEALNKEKEKLLKEIEDLKKNKTEIHETSSVDKLELVEDYSHLDNGDKENE